MKTKQIAIKENGRRRKVTALAVSGRQWDNILNVFENGEGDNYMYSHGSIIPVENYLHESEMATQVRLYMPYRDGVGVELEIMLECIIGKHHAQNVHICTCPRETVAWVYLDESLDDGDETKRLITIDELRVNLRRLREKAAQIGDVPTRVFKYRELVEAALKGSVLMPFLPFGRIYMVTTDNRLQESGAYKLAGNMEYVKRVRPVIMKDIEFLTK